LFALRLVESGRVFDILFMSLSFALASFTRYQAIALGPAMLLAICWCPADSWKGRLKALGIMIAACVVFLMPHFVLNTMAFGSPLYNENWKNIAFMLYGRSPQALEPFTGLVSVFLHSPWTVVQSTGSNFWTWIGEGFLWYLCGNKVLIPVALFCTGMLGGVASGSISLEPKKIVLLGYLGTYLLMLMVFMDPLPRLALPVIPVCLLFACDFLESSTSSIVGHIRRFTLTGHMMACCLIIGFLLYGLVPVLTDFVDRHPIPELNAARVLGTRLGGQDVVVGSFPYMQRYVKYPYRYLRDEDVFHTITSREQYYDFLKRFLAEKKADYLLIGEMTLGRRPKELLTGQGIPGFLKPVMADQGVVVYRVLRSPR
jgi:hypothetical protein